MRASRFTKSTFRALSFAAVCGGGAIGAQAARQAQDKPNVLVILVDDLGYGDLGCQGAKDINTPNIDKLAASGIRFTDGYVTSPQCGPSRAGLISGVFQDRYGYNDIINQSGLPPKSVLLTLPEQMKEQGYVTGMAGKWHVGYRNPEFVHPPEENNLPWKRGFDYMTIHDSGMTHFYNYSEEGAEWNLWRGIDNRYEQKLESDAKPHYIEKMDPEIYMTDYLTDETCAFIKRNETKPWFFFLSYNAPHTPMIPKKGTLEKYDNLKGTRRVFAAMMDTLDEGIGKVIRQIRESGQEKNTMVWFLSDNGGETPHNSSLNGPLAGRKGHLFEGGIRVPFIVAFPGTLPSGKVEKEPISSLDILPTSMALAGAQEIPEIYDGHNVMPWLQGKAKCPSDELFWSFWGNYALRMGDFKEVRSQRNDAKTADGRPVPSNFFSNIRENCGEDPRNPLTGPERKEMLTTRLDERLVQLRNDQKKLTPIFSSAHTKKIADNKRMLTEALQYPAHWIRIPFENIDVKNRIANDAIDFPKTNGFYSKGAVVADGVSGRGLRFNNGQTLKVGKTASTTEMKCHSPTNHLLWVKLAGNPDENDTLIDMTDDANPIEKSTAGYRLQVTPERNLLFSMKGKDGQTVTHLCNELGALPVGEWVYVAMRYNADNEVAITALPKSVAGKPASVVAARTEWFEGAGELTFTGGMLPTVGSNFNGTANFLNGTVDEISLAGNVLSDQDLYNGFKKCLTK